MSGVTQKSLLEHILVACRHLGSLRQHKRVRRRERWEAADLSRRE
jgi:hypothetical protein